MTTDPDSRAGVGRRLTVASLILAGSVLLSRMLGFVRDAVIAYMLGAGRETDAYFAAFTLPDLMNYFLAGGALSITFIPLYGRLVGRGDEAGANRLVSVVAATLGSLLLALVVVAEALTPTLIAPIFPGFDATQLARTAELTRIVLPGQLFFFVGGIVSATLMVRERFVPVALVPVIYNLSIIAFGVVLTPWMGIAGFSLGALVGALVGALGVPLWSARHYLRLRFLWRPRDPQLWTYLKLSLPLMLGVTLLTADEWISRYFASEMAIGTISWLNNARRLMLVPFALIGQAAAQAALPYLTRLAAEERHESLSRTLSGTLRAMLFLATVAAVLLAVLAERAVIGVYERGRFTPADSTETTAFLVFFCPAIVAWATQTVAVRGFYARMDTIRPMLVGTVVTVASLPLYGWLAHHMGGPGLALATSIGLGVNALLTLFVYQRRYGGLRVTELLAGLARGLILAGVAALPIVLADRALGTSILGLGRTMSAWVVLLGAGVGYAVLVGWAARRLGGVEGAAVERLLARLRRRRRDP